MGPCQSRFTGSFDAPWSRQILDPELSFLPAPHIGAEPGRAKGESRITCMRMLRMNQSKISRPQPSAQTIRVCARDALFCQISNMAEDCCDARGFLRYICSSFCRLSRTFSIPKCYIWKVWEYSSKILVLKFLHLELVKVAYGIRRSR